MGLSYGGLADSPDDCVLWESTPDTLSQAGRKNTSIAEKLTPVVFSIGQSWGLGDALTDQCSKNENSLGSWGEKLSFM